MLIRIIIHSESKSILAYNSFRVNQLSEKKERKKKLWKSMVQFKYWKNNIRFEISNLRAYKFKLMWLWCMIFKGVQDRNLLLRIWKEIKKWLYAMCKGLDISTTLLNPKLNNQTLNLSILYHIFIFLLISLDLYSSNIWIGP